MLELLQGSAIVDLRDRFSRQTVTVLVGDARVDLAEVGVYRFDFRPGRTPRLKVFDGRATASAGRRRDSVGEGRSLRLAADSWEITPFNKKRGDRLDGWATERRNLFARQAPGFCASCGGPLVP